MKFILFLGVSLLLTASSCSSNMDVSPGTRTTMEIDPATFDAGEKVKGEFITAKFKVTNTGDYPLVIADVKPSCSCTVAEKPEEPIAPGESAIIVAQVDTDKTPVGSMTKSLNIVSNADPSVQSLKIIATVLKN